MTMETSSWRWEFTVARYEMFKVILDSQFLRHKKNINHIVNRLFIWHFKPKKKKKFVRRIINIHIREVFTITSEHI